MAISLEVFKDADSAKLFCGQFVSQVCDKMMTLGLVWVISAEQSSRLVPWFLAISALPHLLLSLKAGVWASRIGPLKTAIVTDLVRGILFTSVGILWSQIAPSDQVVTIFVLTFLSSMASALFNPAILSLPQAIAKRDLIPQLTAMLDSCFSLSTILGPAVAAILYPEIGLRGLLLLNGLSYFFAAAVEAGIRLSPPVPESSGETPSLSALEVLKSDRLLPFMLSTFFVMNLLLTPMIVFMPLFATQIFHGKISTFAALETSIGIGTVAGGLILSVTQFKIPSGTRAVFGMIVSALMYLIFSLNRNPLVAYGCLTLLGLALATVNVSMLTVFQTRTSPEKVPVLMSLVNLISTGALPFSMLLVGVLVNQVEVQTLALTLALLMVATSIAVAFHREFRRV